MVIAGIILFFFICLFGLFYLNNDWVINEEDKKRAKIAYQDVINAEKAQKGYAFEQIITNLVSEKLKGAIVINNCILNKRSKNGKDLYFNGTIASKEFDIIILSKKGLLVVEAKNFSQAFVSGGLSEKTWLASYSKKSIHQIYSPLKQVTEGVTTLKRYLPDYNFQRYVVFPDSTKIGDNLKKTGQVMSLTEFGWLLDDISNNPDSVAKNSINLIKDLLVEENERARAMHNGQGAEEHLEYVKKCQNASTAS